MIKNRAQFVESSSAKPHEARPGQKKMTTFVINQSKMFCYDAIQCFLNAMMDFMLVVTVYIGGCKYISKEKAARLLGVRDWFSG